jgi:hypothetical protein
MTPTKQKYFATNALGIKQLGIQNWFDTYTMPARGSDYRDIYEEVTAHYLSIFCKSDLDNFTYWLAVANIKITRLVSNYIFHLFRLESLRHQGYTHVLDGQLQTLDQAQAIPFTQELLRKFAFKKVPENHIIKPLIKTAVGAVNVWVSNHILSKNKAFRLGHQSPEMEKYCHVQNLLTIRVDTKAFSITPTTFSLSPHLQSLLDTFITQVISPYPFIDLTQQMELSSQVAQTLASGHALLSHSLKFAKYCATGPLLSDGLGLPFNRTLLAAWRLSGQKTIGFPHGNTFATCYDPIHIDADGLSIVNEIYASSKGQAHLLQALAKDHSRGLKMATVTHPQSSFYIDLFNTLQSEPKITSIKRVMLIGFPLNKFIYPSFPSNHAFSNLHLDIRLAKLLKQHGYTVLYKAHPDKLEEAEGLLNSYVDEFITERFETAYQQADCFIFSYSRTSTFGFAMLTNRPILLMNLDDVFWYPQAREQTQKRCHFIPAKADDCDRILFNAHDVTSALNSALAPIDYSVIHQFAN